MRQSFQNMILHRRKQAYTGRQRPTLNDKGSRSRQSLVVPSTTSKRYDNLYRKSGLGTALGIKLTKVFYVPRVWQWLSILDSQADTSRVVDLGYPEGTLLAGGELVGTLLGKHTPEH
jgi:hypothetical protein